MDAVAELQETFIPTYEGWAGELPNVLAEGPKAFKDWAGQFDKLHATAHALGLDTSKVIAGGPPGSIRSGGAATSTRGTRTRQRTASRRRGSNGAGHPVSQEQILRYLREHPGCSARTIAKDMGASYDTVQKRLRQMTDEGHVRREGERQDTKWFAGQLALH